MCSETVQLKIHGIFKSYLSLEDSQRCPTLFKRQRLFNSPSVFQAANSLWSINGKVAISLAYLGPDESLRLFTFSLLLVPTQDIWAHYWKFFKHSYWCEEVSENTQSTHSTRKLTQKFWKSKTELEHHNIPVLFYKDQKRDQKTPNDLENDRNVMVS